MLDYFALIVLIVLIAVVVAAWIMLAMMPGQIAKKRNHPQAEAINVMGWWGAITMGVLAPIAWVWAYTNPVAQPIEVAPHEHEHEHAHEHDKEDAS
jgi:Kef-type K+ transport system membrane component KefB